MARPLALTLGEPAGIGPDITFAAWRRRIELNLAPFYLLADPQFIARRADAIAPDVSIAVVEPQAASEAFTTALPVVDIGVPVSARAGPSGWIERTGGDRGHPPGGSRRLRRGGQRDRHQSGRQERPLSLGLCRARPHRISWQAQRAIDRGGGAAGDDAVVARARGGAGHHPPSLAGRGRHAHRAISWSRPAASWRAISTTRFAIERPRLAIAGLNPHAGEDGALGDEDLTVVRPAVERLKAEGIDARGPLPADSLFHPAARASYDVALAMYHDQALIPIKTLAFDHAVNVTLGLPFVRTSPDHGTAFDIAGTGRADPTSLIAALQLAARLSARTQSHPITLRDRSPRRRA